MIEGQIKPLELASRVLQPSTLKAVAKAPYNRFGWSILDRWAMNSPALLASLEAQGEVVLLGRLLEQQNREQPVLTEPHPGLATHEVLALHEIPSDLP